MSRKLILSWAALQIGLGAMLLVGTLWMSLATLPAMHRESQGISENLADIADAMDAATRSYSQSIEGVFVLTNTLGDVGGELGTISSEFQSLGGKFGKQANKLLDFAKKCETTTLDIPLTDKDPSFGWFGSPFRGMGEWCRDTGNNLSAIGKDVGSVALAISTQARALDDYRHDGHGKVLEAMSTSAESIHHFSDLFANHRNIDRWCGFLVILGLCVSLLFIMNGAILLSFARQE